MQTPRLSTIAAICLCIFLVWRILLVSDDEAGLVDIGAEKKVVGEANVPHVAEEAHAHEAAHDHEHDHDHDHAVESHVDMPPEQLSCGYEQLAKNLSSTPITMTNSPDVVEKCMGGKDPNNMALFKHIQLPAPSYYDRSYKEHSAGSAPNAAMLVKPGDLPETVHYVWCGGKPFRFQNYLSILSAAKLLQPHKVIFHYHEEPALDDEWYNSWFIELKQSLSSLELQKSETPLACEGEALLDLALNLVTSVEGGFYLGETTLLTNLPAAWKTETAVVHPEDKSEPGKAKIGLLMSKPGFTLDQLKTETAQNAGKATTCRTIADFNQMETSKPEKGASPCVVITMNVYPHEMMDSSAPMAAFARWLYYGTANKVAAEQNTHQVAPRIGHMVRFHDGAEFPFYGYLSVLSTLHMSGIEHLYVYGDKEPEGENWTRLNHEKITFIHIDRATTAFLQPVHDTGDMANVLRYYILWKYGGLYTEYDTVWLKPIPEENWHYPAVSSVDFARHGSWPEYLNRGALMAKPGAAFLKYAIDKLKYFIDGSPDFNALLMTYRAYEQHPRSLHIDYKFQYSDKTEMICWEGVCHPSWHQNHGNHSATEDHHDLSDFTAFHFKYPDVPPSMQSLAALKSGTDTFAQIGKKILDKSGKSGDLS